MWVLLLLVGLLCSSSLAAPLADHPAAPGSRSIRTLVPGGPQPGVSPLSAAFRHLSGPNAVKMPQIVQGFVPPQSPSVTPVEIAPSAPPVPVVAPVLPAVPTHGAPIVAQPSPVAPGVQQRAQLPAGLQPLLFHGLSPAAFPQWGVNNLFPGFGAAPPAPPFFLSSPRVAGPPHLGMPVPVPPFRPAGPLVSQHSLVGVLPLPVLFGNNAENAQSVGKPINLPGLVALPDPVGSRPPLFAAIAPGSVPPQYPNDVPSPIESPPLFEQTDFPSVAPSPEIDLSPSVLSTDSADVPAQQSAAQSSFVQTDSPAAAQQSSDEIIVDLPSVAPSTPDEIIVDVPAFEIDVPPASPQLPDEITVDSPAQTAPSRDEIIVDLPVVAQPPPAQVDEQDVAPPLPDEIFVNLPAPAAPSPDEIIVDLPVVAQPSPAQVDEQDVAPPLIDEIFVDLPAPAAPPPDEIIVELPAVAQPSPAQIDEQDVAPPLPDEIIVEVPAVVPPRRSDEIIVDEPASAQPSPAVQIGVPDVLQPSSGEVIVDVPAVAPPSPDEIIVDVPAVAQPATRDEIIVDASAQPPPVQIGGPHVEPPAPDEIIINSPDPQPPTSDQVELPDVVPPPPDEKIVDVPLDGAEAEKAAKSSDIIDASISALFPELANLPSPVPLPGSDASVPFPDPAELPNNLQLPGLVELPAEGQLGGSIDPSLQQISVPFPGSADPGLKPFIFPQFLGGRLPGLGSPLGVPTGEIQQPVLSVLLGALSAGSLQNPFPSFSSGPVNAAVPAPGQATGQSTAPVQNFIPQLFAETSKFVGPVPAVAAKTPNFSGHFKGFGPPNNALFGSPEYDAWTTSLFGPPQVNPLQPAHFSQQGPLVSTNNQSQRLSPLVVPPTALSRGELLHPPVPATVKQLFNQAEPGQVPQQTVIPPGAVFHGINFPASVDPPSAQVPPNANPASPASSFVPVPPAAASRFFQFPKNLPQFPVQPRSFVAPVAPSGKFPQGPSQAEVDAVLAAVLPSGVKGGLVNPPKFGRPLQAKPSTSMQPAPSSQNIASIQNPVQVAPRPQKPAAPAPTSVARPRPAPKKGTLCAKNVTPPKQRPECNWITVRDSNGCVIEFHCRLK